MAVQRASKVLDSGPSDHRPVLMDLALRESPRQRAIHVAVWNVNHDTNAREAAPVFERIMAHDPDVLILQEIQRDKDGILPFLSKEYNLRYRHGEPEFAVCWQGRGRFTYRRHFVPVMSKTPYWLEHNRALVVVLEDSVTDEVIEFASEHPPAHVQAPGHVTHDKVMKVHHEFVDKRHQLVRKAREKGYHSCWAGDSNIDPLIGWEPPGGWDWAYDRKQSGLNYVRAPEPTHGGHRHIDEGQISDGLVSKPGG